MWGNDKRPALLLSDVRIFLKHVIIMFWYVHFIAKPIKINNFLSELARPTLHAVIKLMPKQNAYHALCRRPFQINFLVWKLKYFDYTFAEICFQWSNQQYGSIGSDNDLAPNRRQVIIWINIDIVHRHKCTSLGFDKLKKHGIQQGPVMYQCIKSIT